MGLGSVVDKALGIFKGEVVLRLPTGTVASLDPQTPSATCPFPRLTSVLSHVGQ